MKDLKGYRLKYKRYYDIDFGSDYIVHHIDFNRSNNSIDNLLLLPKELHTKYHYYLQMFDVINWKSGRVSIDTILQLNRNPYCSLDDLIDFLNVLKECQEWIKYKFKLDDIKYHKSLMEG